MLRFRESRTTIARNSERRKVRWLLNGYRVDILQGEKSSGVWLQKMQTYLILLKWTLESESEVAQSCPTLCDPMDCSLPGSSVHGIFQARVLECVAISFSRASSRPRIEPGCPTL